ncbi:MAG: hypothetical protein J5642_05720 [Bacteroidales bacterium]|nr:hypothetical protein [Bacteroidales bacterium]
MKKFGILFLCMFLCWSGGVRSQVNSPDVILVGDQVDTSTQMIWASAGLSWQFPFGTLRNTFKMNAQVHANLTYKTASNWTFDLGFAYMFGAKVRDQAAVLGSDMLIPTSSGYLLIDGNGGEATIYFEGRYWSTGLGIGKIIPLDKWKNSGLWLKLSGSYFSHKVNIRVGGSNEKDIVPQLAGDYRKGYDQRAGGFCFSQFVGYVFMRKVRVRSFYAGVEISEIWSKSNRNYQFLLMGPDTSKKFSVLVGIKAGWIIPLFEKRKIQTLYMY